MPDGESIPEDALEAADETFEQLDEKVLLAQVVAELQQIRRILSDAESGAQSDTSEDVTEYACTKCAGDVRVPADERERHARKEHRAPPDMVESLFEAVE